jgi:hypothetical protein
VTAAFDKPIPRRLGQSAVSLQALILQLLTFHHGLHGLQGQGRLVRHSSTTTIGHAISEVHSGSGMGWIRWNRRWIMIPNCKSVTAVVVASQE